MATSKTGVPVTYDKIGKSFGAVRVLEEFNLDVKPGEFLVLLGAGDQIELGRSCAASASER